MEGGGGAMGPEFSKWIRENRKARRLSRKAFGDLIGVTGRTIQYWEEEGKTPKAYAMAQIKKHLGEPPAEVN
jgi:DNA-binding transcriptional regulator YiaG